MTKSIKNVIRKKRGRPPVEHPAPVSAVRLPHDLTAQIDKWAEARGVNRSEAIRTLIEMSLGAKASRKTSSGQRDRAAKLAADVIEKRIDATTPPEERETRRTRLLRGPSAFRDVRKDRSK